ncbi:olfactory receptor 10A7-like [Spea bombifrons]|uniref:olfactory receptor 10A7-like n=1 Tax=Spea bombifrons TaxID=233779 RepID=UPI002349213B|nr:olfactory receptor 10A7-like [Spea bombifrons]
MSRENQTSVTEFIILGFTSSPQVQLAISIIFLLIYLVTLFGNGIILLLINTDPSLHTPMYFFLRNLSFIEVCYVSVIIPKLLANYFSGYGRISFTGCATQMYFFLFLGTAECYLLAVMAYDRYVAVCDPLHYSAIMSKNACTKMVAGTWVSGILLSMGNTSFIFSLPYCGPNVIDHFFCDTPPVVSLACTDTSMVETDLFAYTVLVVIVSFIIVLISYSRIIFAILHIKSTAGRQKAFSTCASHITSVCLFFGTGTFMYLRPKSSHSPQSDKIIALLYSVITPLLNPMIYSLRNQEIKSSLMKLINKRILASSS